MGALDQLIACIHGKEDALLRGMSAVFEVGQELDSLTVTMKKGRLIHKEVSEMNGSVLIEELKNLSGRH